MPSKNVVKEYAPESYYHVYNRGVAKQPIFLDSQDKYYFLRVLERHLDPSDSSKKADGTLYRKFDIDVELLCYCLMGNHFHLLFYLRNDARALSSLMQSVLIAYTMYFNLRYKRVGTLFQGVYKASLISTEEYLVHITRYIHLNPRGYKTYRYSSFRFYAGDASPVWVKSQRILSLSSFVNGGYEQFVEDYEDYKAMLDEIKHDLANEI